MNGTEHIHCAGRMQSFLMLQLWYVYLPLSFKELIVCGMGLCVRTPLVTTLYVEWLCSSV
jgi:hypothetical protein